MMTCRSKTPVLYYSPVLLFLFLQAHPAIGQPGPGYRKKTDPKVVFDSSLMNKASGLEFKIASFMPQPLKFSIGDYTMNAVVFERKVLSDSQVNKRRFDPLGAIVSSAASGENINDYKSRKFDSRSASEYRFDFELAGYNRITKVKSHAARFFEATGKTAAHGNEGPSVSYSKLIDTIRVFSTIQPFTDSLSWVLELQLVENDSTPRKIGRLVRGSETYHVWLNPFGKDGDYINYYLNYPGISFFTDSSHCKAGIDFPGIRKGWVIFSDPLPESHREAITATAALVFGLRRNKTND